jgi:hypothetical protein
MPLDTTTLFSQVIQDHLELKERNAELDHELPLERYRTEDPFENHPLFKTEEQARLEETMDGAEPAVAVETNVLKWPGEDGAEREVEAHEGLWSRSRDFDWGD